MSVLPSTMATDRADVAPAATRSRPPGWRNPRLLLGLVLVAASVVLGARLMASADDTVPVWALTRDLPAGSVVSPADLEARNVRFPDETTADAYLSAGDQVPSGSKLARAVSAGELLPRSALAKGDGPALVEVPISVASDDLPATVHQGSHVDVWVTPKVSAVEGRRPTATKVLDDVVVVAVPGVTDRLAPQTTRQVIVGIPEQGAGQIGAALGATSDGHVVVARHG
jgi:SAF domain-containing protein